jgi:hypothetical protein
MSDLNRLKALRKDLKQPIDWQRGDAVIYTVGNRLLKFLSKLPHKSAKPHYEVLRQLLKWYESWRNDSGRRSIKLGQPLINEWLVSGFTIITRFIKTLQIIIRDGITVRSFIGCGSGVDRWLIGLYETQAALTGSKTLLTYLNKLEAICKST